MSENWSRRVLEVGDRLAGYQVESFVARGGMAVVYRARDLSLDRVVALKVIAPELASHDKFRQRFMRESELAASIDHPNIIPIYAAGEEDRLLYLVMRYVPGDDLGTAIRERGVLRPREALPLFTQVAGALDAAHARQLVHRDVKPGNILLSGDDDLAQRHVYLSDFGLTKRLSSLTGFTTAGHFLGTIQYVAPEQVANRAVDHRTDIYSLACVIYEALAGEPPFVREDDAALLWSHMTQEPPPISSRRDDLPKALDPVLAGALSKNADDRPVNCRTLVSDLRQAFRPPSRTSPPPSRGPSEPSKLSTKPVADTADDASARAADRPAPVGRTSVERHRTKTVDRGVVPHDPGGQVRRPRRAFGLAAVAFVLAMLATLGTWFAVDRYWLWQEYSGENVGQQVNEAGVRLEHPRSWEPRLHSGQFAVFAPQDFTPLFTPNGNWDTVRGVAASDPEEVVGAYVSSAGWLNLPSLTPLDLAEDVQGHFETSAKLDAAVRQPAGASDRSFGLVGTMTPLDAAEPRLYFEFIALKSGTRQGVVLLFCLDNEKEKHAPTFERVLKSARLP